MMRLPGGRLCRSCEGRIIKQRAHEHESELIGQIYRLISQMCIRDSMKLELLVIANQHVAVNAFPGLVHTARHTMEVGGTRSQWPNRKEGAVEGEINDWGDVVTR